jgi:hypothetical protein
MSERDFGLSAPQSSREVPVAPRGARLGSAAAPLVSAQTLSSTDASRVDQRLLEVRPWIR